MFTTVFTRTRHQSLKEGWKRNERKLGILKKRTFLKKHSDKGYILKAKLFFFASVFLYHFSSTLGIPTSV
jgi:hypothetical protein